MEITTYIATKIDSNKAKRVVNLHKHTEQSKGNQFKVKRSMALRFSGYNISQANPRLI
ncbi:hypothetical protein [Dongshaea marina]|uniref:hypothetical protein n=1 Tax=Dongshaea marina TaxID=2047966 RepID=UPI00131F274A|nr:hypothetical protein [Dongshaea marina]